MIQRSEYAGRSSMSRAQCAALLKELEEVRFEDGLPVDGGTNVSFRALSLQ